jgi:hypothetical protein
MLGSSFLIFCAVVGDKATAAMAAIEATTMLISASAFESDALRFFHDAEDDDRRGLAAGRIGGGAKE